MTEAARKTSDGASRRSLVDVAKEMHPLFAGRAAANEAKGSLTDETIKALWDGGFFGMWIPKSFGGIEAGPLEALGTVEQLSYSDGSTENPKTRALQFKVLAMSDPMPQNSCMMLSSRSWR